MVASLRKLAIDDGDRAAFVPSVSITHGCDSTRSSTGSSISSSSQGGTCHQPSSNMSKKARSASASSSSSAHKNAPSSCSTSSISPYAYNSSCMVTPPMSLPSRGWGDSGGGSSGGSFRSRQHVYPNSGFSCHHAAPTSYTSSSNYSVHDNSRHDGVAEGGGDRGRVGGDSAKGGVGNGAGAPQQQQLRLERFSLSDGFSSAEEETWGSEGEIEEGAVAGRRHALVTAMPTGPTYHLGANASDAAVNGIGDGEEEEEGDGMDEESRGLLVRGGSKTAMVAVAAAATKTAIAPSCGDGGLGVGSRRKAAVGAGRAKRRTCLGARGGGRGASADRTRVKSAGAGGRAREGAGRWCGNCSVAGGGNNNRRPRKVSRSLFIEIENKASEPPRVPRHIAAQKRTAAARGRRGKSAAVGQQQRRRRQTGHTSGSADDGDNEEGDSDDDDTLCGCAQRCLRLADSWYHAIVGGPPKVKFSELDQIADMPPSAMP